MDYKEKYEMALERAKKFIEENPLVQNLNTWIKETFPELTESEDEKVRKALIEMVHDTTGDELWVDYNVHKEEALAWLEKQGQVKDSAISQHDNKTCKENDGSLTSEDEKIRKWLIGYFHQYKEDGMERYANGLKVDDILAWLEKQGKSSDQIHYWTEEEIEPIISDYLRGAEHYGGMIGRLRCLKPKSLEKQSETYTKRDVDNAWLEGMASAKRELEKQGEQKPTDKVKPKFKVGDKVKMKEFESFPHICTVENIDSDVYYCDFTNFDIDDQNGWELVKEPKFKVGDWVIDKQDIVHQIANVIENVTNHTYGYDIVGGGYFNDNTEGVRLWTIQDAKDGDVIACENGRIGIFKCLNDNLFSSYCFIDNEGWFCGDEGQVHILDTIICGEIYPATKEQRDLLFSKMNEAGYVWDADKKELKKIEQKSAWSEEDDVMIYKLFAVVELYYDRDGDDLDKQSCISFLKSIKNKVLPKQEWSEEDEKIFNRIIRKLDESDNVNHYDYTDFEMWLIDLKERLINI